MKALETPEERIGALKAIEGFIERIAERVDNIEEPVGYDQAWTITQNAIAEFSSQLLNDLRRWQQNLINIDGGNDGK